MREFTFISKHWVIALLLLAAPLAWAQGKPASDSGDLIDDNFLSGPFSEYGEFSSDEDEEADERFFQSGRFFGVGLGVGLTTATGNAGTLYQGGFPTIDARLNYWFDFFVALQLNVKNSVHNYELAPDGRTRTNLFRLLGQIKYYFDTKDLSAPITFVSPHLIFGAGMYRRTDNMSEIDTTETASSFGLNFGAGLELTIKPKKFYLQIESTVNVVTFRDAYDNKYTVENANAIPDRTGLWIDTTAAFVWTW